MRLLLVISVWLTSVGSAAERVFDEPLSRLACGSCAKDEWVQPIWATILEAEPERFVFMGDTIYGDSTDPNVLKKKYDRLRGKPGYKLLRESIPVDAIWDDHDYGVNDAGAEHPTKAACQQVFLDAFDVPTDHPRRSQAGVYDARVIGPVGQRMQILLLDTRYHRGPLVWAPDRVESGEGFPGKYGPNNDPDATILGDAQWTWLEEQLEQPAEFRVVVSSIQVIPTEQRFEKWANFPHERARLLDLLASASGTTVILSGDRHHAELSEIEHHGVTLRELTSSSLNQKTRPQNERNRYRVGDRFLESNFGMVLVDWHAKDGPVVRLQVRDIRNLVMMQLRFRFAGVGREA